jgi:hypothetical protein
MQQKKLLQKKIEIYMHSKKGFSLLSFLLYLVLFTIITVLSCHIIVSLIIPSLVSMRRCQSVIALHIASDLFVRDIRAIKPDECHWKLVTSHELVWQADNHDVGWSFTNNRLERKEGEYNKGWKSKNTSIVATGISQVVFAVEKVKDKSLGVEMVITPINAPKKPIICYVAVKQGESK